MGKNFTFLKNIYRSNTWELNSIAKLIFCVTFKCNLKCKICSIWKKDHREELSVGEIEKMFKKLPNLSWLDLTGGEIALREDLIDVIRTIITHSRNLKGFHMTSNGMLPEKIIKAAQEVIRLKLKPVISISIDGPPEVHDLLRGHKGSYAQAIKTFTALKSLKNSDTHISCTISKFNLKYIDEFVAALKKDVPRFSMKDLHFNFYHVSGHYYANETLGEKGKEGIGFSHIRKYFRMRGGQNFIKNYLEDKYLFYLEKYLNGEKISLACQALHGSVFVDAYGTVFPCLYYNRPIGRLNEIDYDINKLLKSPDLDQLKIQVKHQDCDRCWSDCEAYPMIIGNLLKLTKPASN